MTKVKICGLTGLDDANAAAAAGADILGFIFTPKSPRAIKPEAAKKIIEKTDPFVLKAGVFLDQDRREVLDIARLLKLDVIQLHGSESAAYCRALNAEFKVIKVLFPRDTDLEKAAAAYKTDALLLDIKPEDKARGKSTLSIKEYPQIAAMIAAGKKVIISAGLNVGNIGAALKFKPYGVDVASGIEKFVGKKDHALMAQFINKVKSVGAKPCFRPQK